LVAGPDGCVAVDALVIRRTAGAAGGERAPARAAPATPR